MRIDIVTVFPEMVAPALDHSIVKRARERGLITVNVVNLRDFTTDRHRTTDDIPYGGGGGMVMKIEPIARALEALTCEEGQVAVPAPFDAAPPATGVTTVNEAVENETVFCGVPSTGWDAAHTSLGPAERPRIVLTDPRGPRFTQETAKQWACERHLIILCGHYEGVDERVRQHLVTDEVSIGDYILTGGELPALIIVDALTRLQPGALGDEQAPDKDTFADDLLEYPHYTRPRDFNGWLAPDILLCGHHAQIQRWRRWHQLRATRERRPDLFARLHLTAKDLALLDSQEPSAPVDPKVSRRNAPEPVRITTSNPTVEQTAHDAANTVSNPTVEQTAHDDATMTSNPTVEQTAHYNEKHEVTDGSGTANHT